MSDTERTNHARRIAEYNTWRRESTLTAAIAKRIHNALEAIYKDRTMKLSTQEAFDIVQCALNKRGEKRMKVAHRALRFAFQTIEAASIVSPSVFDEFSTVLKRVSWYNIGSNKLFPIDVISRVLLKLLIRIADAPDLDEAQAFELMSALTTRGIFWRASGRLCVGTPLTMMSAQRTFMDEHGAAIEDASRRFLGDVPDDPSFSELVEWVGKRSVPLLFIATFFPKSLTPLPVLRLLHKSSPSRVRRSIAFCVLRNTASPYSVAYDRVIEDATLALAEHESGNVLNVLLTELFRERPHIKSSWIAQMTSGALETPSEFMQQLLSSRALVRGVFGDDVIRTLDEKKLILAACATIAQYETTMPYDTCPITQEQFEVGEWVAAFPCFHTFKFDTVLEAIRHDTGHIFPRCPMCRVVWGHLDRKGDSPDMSDVDAFINYLGRRGIPIVARTENGESSLELDMSRISTAQMTSVVERLMHANGLEIGEDELDSD